MGIVQSQNICIEGGPYHTDWQCLPGAVTPGTASTTNLTVCAGAPITLPTLNGGSVGQGVMKRGVTFDCPENSPYEESVNVSFSSYIVFSPPIPQQIFEAGIYTFDAYHLALSSGFCPIIVTNLQTVTITVTTCTNHLSELINVDFGELAGTPKIGFAAIGYSTNDVWNQVPPLSQPAAHYAQLVAADSTLTSVGLTVSNLTEPWANGAPDQMYRSYLYEDSEESPALIITNLPPGRWSIYLYSHDGSFTVSYGSTNYGTRSTEDPAPATFLRWTEGQQYCVFSNVVVGGGEPVTITIHPGDYGLPAISGMQIAASWWAQQDYDSDGIDDQTEHYFGLNSVVPNSNSQVRLGLWKFNNIFWYGEQGQGPKVNSGLDLSLVDGLENGAVDLAGEGTAKKLAYNYIESNGQTNLDLKTGTIRFWFKPNWTSVTNGGNGPGTAGRLVSMGSYTAGASVGVWEILLNAAGDAVSMRVQNSSGQTAATPSFTIPGGMLSNQWRQFCAVYSPSAVILYIDGVAVGTSGGLNGIVPPESVRSQGFYIGTDNTGAQKSSGSFELLETLNYLLTSQQISTDYSTAWYFADTDKDNVPDGWQRLHFGSLSQTGPGDYDGDGLNNFQEYLAGSNPTVANAPAIAAPPQNRTVFTGSSVTFQVVPTGLVLANYGFQWQVNGRAITDATNATLFLSNVSFTNTGVYSVLVSNVAGTLKSTLTRLTVWTPGTISAWGLNTDGLGTVPSALSTAVGLACGRNHSLGLTLNGTVVGWGANPYGQTTVPTTVTNVAALAAGGYFSLALRNDGTVVGWGDNYYGQLTVPSGVQGNAIAIAGGHNHSLALKADGTVTGWGDNAAGQCNVPAGLNNVVSISAGLTHNLALKSDGTVVSWGTGPTTVPGSAVNVVGVYAGQDYSAVVLANGTIVAWGANGSGQTTVPGSAVNVVALSSGPWPQHVIAVRRDQSLVAWGRNDQGQATVPSGIADAVTISGGERHSLALHVVDGDGDGLPGAWERQYFGSTERPGSGDHDGDGLTDLQEYVSGSNPTVANAPAISVQPQSRTVSAGTNVFFTVIPAGASLNSYAFQWQINGRNIPGATNPTLMLSNVGFSNTAVYSVVVSNVAGTVKSTLARLTVWTPGTVVAWGRNDYGQSIIPSGLSGAVAAGAGTFHSIALKSDGTVTAWGFNGDGETAVPVDATNVAAIAACSWFNLALRDDGSVLGWGWNGYGQLNIPAGLSNVVAIAGGYAHSVALKSDGIVVCWGLNNMGQATVPIGLSNVIAISAGGTHTLAVKRDGTVVGWGENLSGDLSFPGTLNDAVMACGGRDHSSFILSNGTVSVVGNSADTTVPSAATNVVALSSPTYAHPEHFLALRRDGGMVAWGDNAYGQSTLPSGLGDAVSVAAGQYHSLAVQVNDADGDQMPGHWERQYFGNVDQADGGDYDGDGLSNLQEYLGASNPTTANAPVIAMQPQSQTVVIRSEAALVVVPTGMVLSSYGFQWQINGRPISDATNATLFLSNVSFTNTAVYSVVVSNVAGTLKSTLARLTVWTPGTISAWGLNTDGLGTVPTSLSTAVGLACGRNHSLGLTLNGTVVGWGANPYGQTTVPPTVTNVAAIVAGGYFSLALRNDGTVVGWGDNYYGQLNVPTDVQGNAVAIAGGHNHSLALKADGTVVAWGDNGAGQGNVPAGLTNVVSISAGYAHNLALKSDGTVVSWGTGPTTVPTSAVNVVGVYSGQDYSAVVLANGTIVAWGANGSGQTTVPGSAVNVVALSSGSWPQHVIAVLRDQSLLAWGRNDQGQATLPSAIADAVAVSAGYQHSLALHVVDGDGDGLPGSWERQYFGNAEQTDAGDFDGDGLSNLQEYLGASNPAVANAPAIAVHPQSRTVLSGGQVTLAVVPTGSVLSSYGFQWQVNGRPITDATNATLTLINAGFTNTAVYSVILSNVAGTLKSSLARLTVWTPGTISAWGWNTNGLATVPGALSTAVGIACGHNHSLGLTLSGTAVGWGANHYGQTTVPTTVTNVAAIAAGGFFSLALRNNGTVVGWGDDYYGQLNVPANVQGNAVAIAGGHNHSLALKADGTVVAWGANGAGQCNVPAGLNNAVSISAGYTHNLALKSDGTVVGWGTGPTTVPGSAVNVIGVYAGQDFSAVILTNGTIVAWGANGWGQTTVPGTAVNVAALCSGPWAQHAGAVRRDQSVVVWGRNDQSQATLPSGIADAVAVSAGQWHSLALHVVDGDGDGLPGSWERQFFGNTDQTPTADPDGDGLSNLREYLENTNPATFTSSRLGSWRFNRNDWIGDQGQIPLVNTGLGTSLVLGMEGGAVNISATNAAKQLSYRVGETNGNANIRLDSGTVRIWFKADWNSDGQGGTGPGSLARILNIGQQTGDGSYGLWALIFDTVGDSLFLAVEDDDANMASSPLFTIPNGIIANQWYQIAAVYTPSSVAIYVNGTSIGTSGGLQGIAPPQSVQQEGFYVGIDSFGELNCKGAFEFLETFNYAKTATEISNEYSDTDIDGVLNAQDGDFSNPLIRQLIITIEKPAPGAVIAR